MKTKNKVLYKILSLTLLIGITTSTFISFASPSDFAKDDYFLLKYEGLLNEKLSNQLNLSQNISRQEFAELAVKLYSKASKKDFSLIPKNNPFNDTDNEYVAMAYNVGIIKGDSDTKFLPNETLTREQLAIIIYNELKILDVDISFDNNITMTDKDSVSSSALDAVKFCIDNDILSKDSAGNIKAKERATREQAISSVSRIAKKYSWIEQVEELSDSSYKNINGFNVPISSKTDLLIYKPDNSDISLRIYHNGITNLDQLFDFKKLDKEILDILDKHNLYDYRTSFMVSEYVKNAWDNTNKTFSFNETKYFKDGNMLSFKPAKPYIEIKSGSYLEINIYN